MVGIGISGTGRIGRLLIRKLLSEEETRTSVRAINSIHPPETIAHLLKYDSVHGKWEATITFSDQEIYINGNVIKLTCSRSPENIPWEELGVNLAIDATGKFKTRQEASRHIAAGASTVIITAPGNDLDLTVVQGVNHHLYDPINHTFLSTASCTTNCVAPLLKLLDDEFGVKAGWLTSVHAMTSDQRPLDNPHKDLRRARASTHSIVPTTTGVGKALQDVLPHLAPHIEGTAIRVPTQDVSLADLTVQLENRCTVEQIKNVFKQTSNKNLEEIVSITEEPLVSVDYVGSTQSAIVDGPSVMVMEDQVKILAWYDNEWAYTCRVAEFSNYVIERMIESEKS